MKVLFFPFDPLNPYQTELARSLGPLNVEVVTGTAHLFAPLLWSVWKRPGTEVVHLHWISGFLVKDSFWKSLFWSMALTLEVVSLKLLRKKLVWTVHNLLEHERRHPELELFFLRILAHLWDQIIVHNEYARNQVLVRLKIKQAAKVHVVPHGHYIDAYPNTISRREARRELEIDMDRKTFLFLGQIRDYKGLDELLSAFGDSSLSNCLLLVAGRPQPPELQPRLLSRSAGLDNVRFDFNFIPVEKVQVYMKATDVVVFPFRDIFTSGSIMLAMSFGAVLLVPDIPSLKEIITEMNGETYLPGSENGLREALLRLVDSDTLLQGDSNRDYAARFDWGTVAGLTKQVYLSN